MGLGKFFKKVGKKFKKIGNAALNTVGVGPKQDRQARDARRAAEAANNDMSTFRQLARARGTELRNLSSKQGGYDQGTADRYYKEMEAPQVGEYSRMTGAMAGDFTRRGMQRSGAAMAAQAQLASGLSGNLGQTRLQAIRNATEEKQRNYEAQRQSMLDQYNAELGIINPGQNLMEMTGAIDQSNQEYVRQLLADLGKLAASKGGGTGTG